jgi:hypothetical protein
MACTQFQVEHALKYLSQTFISGSNIPEGSALSAQAVGLSIILAGSFT